jgi:putative transcriptional regulator
MSGRDLKADVERALKKTDDEIVAAAPDDPDNPPMTEEQLAEMRRISVVKRIRRKLALSQEEFSRRFQIPLEMLRDWELGRSEPDRASSAYLRVIERERVAVERALAEEPA